MDGWRWYVYELVDPRDGQAFYVGKGCGNRIQAHEKEARDKPGVCSEKLNKIRDIWKSGEQVVRQFVAYFKREADAYEYEAERIESYGLDNLTNVLPGGGIVRERGYVGRPASEWSPMVAAKIVAGKNAIADWLAIYIKGRNHGAVTFSGDKLHVDIAKVAMEVIIPMLWQTLKSSKEALSLIDPVMRDRGIVFEYGGAKA